MQSKALKSAHTNSNALIPAQKAQISHRSNALALKNAKHSEAQCIHTRLLFDLLIFYGVDIMELRNDM